MRKELDNIIDIYLKKMKQHNWGISDLHQAMEQDMSVASVRRHLTGQFKYPNSRLIVGIGRALEVEESVIKEAQVLAVKLSEGYQRKEKKETVSAPEAGISALEERLRKARNYFELGRKELQGVDEQMSRIVNDILERIRSVNGLKSHLEIFSKH